MKKLFFLSLYLLVCGWATAQNSSWGQNIFVWDVFQQDGKKTNDPLLVTDIEKAIAAVKGSRVLERRDFPSIPLVLKNEKANQKTDRVSDAVAKRLLENGVKNIVFPTIGDPAGKNAVLTLKIYSLESRSLVFSKDLMMDKPIFENQRDKRKSLLSQFFKKEVFDVPSPTTPILIWSGVGVGAAATAVGLLQLNSANKNWRDYYAGNPFDSEKKYPTENSKYKTGQYLAIGGGVVLAASSYFLVKKMQQQKRKKAAQQKTSLSIVPSGDNTTSGIGISWRF